MVNKLKKAKEDIEELKRKTDDKREIDFKAHENTENGSKDPLKSDSFDLELSQNQKTDYWLDKPFGVVIFTLNMAKNIIGSFLIFIPWTFTLSGVVLGNIMLVLIYFFTAYSFSLIGFLGKKTRKNSYSLMFEDIGTWLVVLVDFSIIGITISANAGYQLVISSRIMSIIKFYQNYDFPNWAIVLIVSIFVLFPLSLFKRLDSLRFVSITAFVAIIFLVAGILYFIFDLDTSKAEISLFSKTPYSFFVAFPILAGNFDCHTNAVTFFLEYSDKTK
ncbi:Vacuolar amino acid transporter 7, partial [Bonamia ostreae]